MESGEIFIQGNRAILSSYDRWYYMTLMSMSPPYKLGSIAFPRQEQGESIAKAIKASGQKLLIKDLAPHFRQELEMWISDSPEKYLDLLRSNKARMILGFHSDQLSVVDFDESNASSILTQLKLILSQGGGPYLHIVG